MKRLKKLVSRILNKVIASSITYQLTRIFDSYFASSSRQIENVLMLQGRALALHNADRAPFDNIQKAEFKVFSQFGEDGILQYLIRESGIEVHEQIFVEFGVENYSEANTRFLLQSDHWRGLIIDGNPDYIKTVKNGDIYWRNDITAIDAWIHRDNINELIGDSGFAGKIGLLSIDLDGNDFWIWEAIKVIDPIILVIEWNSVFGSEHAVSIPYNKSFNRMDAHYSCLYWGASMKAFEFLGNRKGYKMLGSNRVGNNLFFVKEDRVGRMKCVSTSDAYVISRFRDSRDTKGNLNFLSGSARYNVISELPLIEVNNLRTTSLKELDSGK